jgi:hypothetical protein
MCPCIRFVAQLLCSNSFVRFCDISVMCLSPEISDFFGTEKQQFVYDVFSRLLQLPTSIKLCVFELVLCVVRPKNHIWLCLVAMTMVQCEIQ